MKEIFLGTFYGKEIILKDDGLLPKEEWQNRWTNYMVMLKKDAVDAYEEEKLLKEMESYKPSKIKMLKRLLKRLIN